MSTWIERQTAAWYERHPHPYRVLESQVVAPCANQVVLDIGCGRTAPVLHATTATARRPIGLDLVPFASNGGSRVALVNASGEAVPLRDHSVDLLIARSVVEHLEQPALALREWARVLRPGGRALILTPNFFDYASLIAHLIPNGWHAAVVRRTEGRDEADTFPTHSRANTARALRRIAHGSGLTVERLDYLSQHPNYLAFHPIPFAIGLAYAGC